MSMMRKLLLTALFSAFLLNLAMAQDRVVSGKVTSADDGTTLPGVSVLVQGTTKGTATDANGAYSISLASGENTLVFSFIGYKTQTMTVGSQSAFDVSLEVDVTTLNEVVVVGYGTQRKADITGAIVQVSGEEVSKQASINPISALQGKVAGVQITNSGQPGASPEIRIRGTGTVYGNPNPLYVVDGVWLSDISFLNPADIASISVLKDPSSQSIYGVRAANGVILITTTKGIQGAKPTISYNGFIGSQVATNLVDMANGPQYAQIINELDAVNNATTVRYPDPNIYGTTDWYRQILRSALISNHNVSISGGGENSTYNLSLGYLKQEGTVETNDFQRFTLKLQNDFKPLSFIKVGYSINSAVNNSNDVNNGIFNQIYTAAPLVPVYYADGTYGDPNDFRVGNSNNFNPQVTLDFFDRTSRNYRISASAYAEAEFAKHFKFRTSVGTNFGQNEVEGFTPLYTATLSQRTTISTLNRNRLETRDWLTENTLSYQTEINEHSINALVGQGAQYYKNYGIDLSIQGVPNNSRGDYYFRLGDPSTISFNDLGDGRNELSTVISYFGRVNYAFRDKYLLTATYRADGLSKYQGDNRWGYFPSIGAGWVVSKETFMQNQTIFDNLKIRGSWGLVGNSSVPANTSILRVSRPNEYIYVGGDGSISPGANIDTQVPPTTFWEKTEGINIGFEAAFLNNKLTTEVDYYSKKTVDAIFAIPILRSLGTAGSTIVGNQADILNKGWEFLVTWNDQIGSDFNYSISANLGFNQNEVTRVSTGANPIDQAVGTTGGATNTRTVLGQPIGHFFGLKVAGVFQSQADIDGYTSSEGTIIQPVAKPGDFKYVDTNDDGVIDGRDRVVLGNPNPRVVYGINTAFSYKRFDVALDLQGVAGVEIYNAALGFRFGTENFTKDFFENRWNGPGTSNTYPSANIGGGNNYVSNSFFVENGDYLRIRNFQVGYSLPTELTEKWKISKLRVYANAQNALNFFKYRGFNPEVGGGPTRAGVDLNVYPLYATYNLGVNVTF
jgi:TonB-linked SusC/RagA family outer membrane protein